MNTVLLLALTSLPGADPAPASGGTCACKASSTTSNAAVTPVAAKQERQPLFHRLSGLFGRNRHKNEVPNANPQQPQFNLNAYNNFRSETVILPEPMPSTVPVIQGPMLLPSGPATFPATQAPPLIPTGPSLLPRTPSAPTTAEPPLN